VRAGIDPDRAAATADVEVAVRGDVAALTAEQEALLLARGRAADPEVVATVAAVIAEVRAGGDDALRAQARRFDAVDLDALEVPRAELAAALAALAAPLRVALEEAAAAIATFHARQLPEPFELETRPGVRLGRRAEPLARVGVYAPGGRAAYPSSVLMGVVPAKVAGVGEVVVCSPPGPDGRPPAVVLAAGALAGADRVFAIGGAGAVAAMAFGTSSVPRVDKVVGPGNAYVTEAKRQLAAVVASDCPAGPSEVLVVADASAVAELVAVELLAQAEHDPDAAAVLVAVDPTLPARVAEVLGRLLASQPRAEIVRRALASRGALLVADSLATALAFANRYAPEHLVLMVADPRAALADVRAAGTVFLGGASSVAFGDYLTGANHVLPTAGWARAWGGLGTGDFLRGVTWQEISADGAAALASPTAALADAEGLPGHALAARLRGAEAARDDGDEGKAAPSQSSGPARRGPVARRCLDAVAPYAARHDADLPVALADNTNLFGVPPAAAAAIAALPEAAVTRYPSPYADALRECLASRFGVAAGNVTTGCGSDDLLDSTIRAFCHPGDTVAVPAPTFGIVPAFARVSGALPRSVPLLPDLSLDVEAILATGATVTYLCRPNNPTGTLVAREQIARVAERARGLVILDEAYAEFAGEDLTAWCSASRNVVSLRTLSKAWGLAGLRVGYAVGPAELIAAIDKARGPYKVGAVAEAAALAALGEDEAWVLARVDEARTVRERLTGELRARSFDVLPSAANFVFARISESCGAAALAARLRERGVAVRAFTGLPVVGDGIRVTVGPWMLMERFLEALDEIGPGRGVATRREGAEPDGAHGAPYESALTRDVPGGLDR
jgi:histidinol dehydrogenase